MYCGYLFDGAFYGILTEFIKGSYPTSKDLDKCKQALEILHNLYVFHYDARIPNFIISDDNVNGKTAYILDFGRSKIETQPDEDMFKKDFKMLEESIGKVARRFTPSRICKQSNSPYQ